MKSMIIYVCLIIVVICAALEALPITVLKNLTSYTVSNRPVTLAMAFCEGELQSVKALRIQGTSFTDVQWDVKRVWPDNSIKHALVSFVVMSIPANDSITVAIDHSLSPTVSNTPIAPSALLATDFDAVATFTKGGQTVSVSARTLLESQTSQATWIAGPIATEYILRGRPQTTLGVQDSDLCVQFNVRVFQGAKTAAVTFAVENIYEQRIHDIRYDVSLSLGKTSTKNCYTKSSVRHYYCSRWRKDYVWGDSLPDIEIHRDIPYLISTGLIQRYNLNLKAAASATKTTQVALWANEDKDILQFAKITPYMPMTGGREDIGPNPGWIARWILCQQKWAEDIACGTANMAGTFSIHYRESDTARLISITKRPNASLNWWCYGQTNADIKKKIDSCTSPGTADDAHTPNMVYVPYLLTGDYYYLEELYYWVNWFVLLQHWSNRQYSRGILTGQVRAEAWMLRTLGEISSLAPDAHAEKNYFNKILSNNLTYRDSLHLHSSAGHPLGIWKPQDIAKSSAPNDFTCMAPNVTHSTSPWMDDFVTFTFDHLVDLGFDSARALRDYKIRFGAGRYGSDTSEFNPYEGTAYRLATICTVGTVVTQINDFKTLAKMSFKDSCGHNRIFDPSNEYNFWARCALSSYNRLDSANAAAEKGYLFLKSKMTQGSNTNMDFITDFKPGAPRVRFVGTEKFKSELKDEQNILAVPNPFNPVVAIHYPVSFAYEGATLMILDCQGRMVADLTNEMKKCTGRVVWNGADKGAGVYIARLSSGESAKVCKLLLVR